MIHGNDLERTEKILDGIATEVEAILGRVRRGEATPSDLERMGQFQAILSGPIDEDSSLFRRDAIPDEG